MKKELYSSSLKEWTFLNLDFSETKRGIKLIYDQKDNSLGDMQISTIMIDHSADESMSHMNHFKCLFESMPVF